MKVLLLSPHPDDVELSAGGTLIKLLDRKYEIQWVVFSTVEDAVPEGMPKDTLEREFLSVLSTLGIKNYKIFHFENKNFPKYRQQILDKLDKIKEEFEPDLVIAPSLNDIHQDHQTIAHEATREFKRDTSIIGYETPWNNLRFNPQLFVRLEAANITKKWDVLTLYKSQFIQKRNYFSKDFIFGLARMRGGQCNSEYAEAFEVIRWIVE